jgi:hypothetical protein
MGLLDLFGVGQGGGGILGDLGRSLRDNRNAIGGFGSGPQAMAQGAQVDMAGQRMQQQMLEAQLQAKATEAAAKRLGIEGVNDPKLLQIMLQQQNTAADNALAREQFNFSRQQALAPKPPAYGEIGENEYGGKQYGWIDPRTRSVTPLQGSAPQQAAGPQSGEPAIPPAPPGVNPKIWRDEQTKARAQQGQPTAAMQHDLSKREEAAANLQAAMTNYNDLVKTNGVGYMRGPAKSALKAAHSRLIIQLKEAAALGVINAPDLPLLLGQIEDATSDDPIEAAAKAPGLGGRVQAQAGEMQKLIDAGLESARKSYGPKGQPSTAGAWTEVRPGVRVRKVSP